MALPRRPVLGLILALGFSVPFSAESAEPLDWRPWNEWDNATKSFVPIDAVVETRDEVRMAYARLNPDVAPFLFVSRESRLLCGSAGCRLEVLAPVGNAGMTYQPFGSWTVHDVAIDTSSRVNGWYGLVLSGNTWVFNGSEYTLP